jgi:hypothetical protein
MSPTWLSVFLKGTGGFGPTAGSSCAEAGVTNPATKSSPSIAAKKVTPIERIGFKLVIVSTLKPKSAPAN